jgi:NAD(P)-dependent dehydrogenase (short-subunit alcohol dehydrogenase family)
MSTFGLKRMFDQKWNPPKPATESFAGRTILLTGATSGLGFEAAKKFVGLHADKLIITARSDSKGQAAKKQIEEWAKLQPKSADAKQTEIIPMVLVMSSFADVQKFANELKAQFPGGIDGAILNAGMMNTKYIQSSDGWEETLQVNTLSTFLLGLLILPLLIAAADSGKNANYKPHLTFISSGTAWTVQPDQMKVFMASEKPLEDLSQQENFPGGMAGGAGQYARSKLTLEYAVRHLAASPAVRGADGKPKVIINTSCPGLCKSDLGREVGKGNPLIKLLTWLLWAIFARTAEDGANTYATALELGDEIHGEMWKNDRVFEVGPMLASDEGKKFGDKMWSEVVRVILKADPSVKAFLG